MISRGRGRNCSLLLSGHEVGFVNGLVNSWEGKLVARHRKSHEVKGAKDVSVGKLSLCPARSLFVASATCLPGVEVIIRACCKTCLV